MERGNHQQVKGYTMTTQTEKDQQMELQDQNQLSHLGGENGLHMSNSKPVVVCI